VEIIEFHSTFSRHGNAQASLTLLIWLNEKVQKLNSKLIALRAEIIFRTEIIVMRRNFHFPLRGELVVIKKKCINIVGMGKKMLLCRC